MAEKLAPDDAAKARIITHMNNDHHDSIIRYLEYHSKLSAWHAYDGQLADIDLDGMTVQCRGQRHRISFDPPLGSLRDARERLVQLDRDARAALRQSDITVTEYVPPTGLKALEFAIVTATFIGYSQRWWFAPGAAVAKLLGPGFARFSWAIQPYLLWGMLAIHSAEMLYFMHNTARTYSINPRTRLFWLWSASTFVGGIASFSLLHTLVRRKQEEREKQKH